MRIEAQQVMVQRAQPWFHLRHLFFVLFLVAIFPPISVVAKDRAVQSALPDCPTSGGPLTWTDCYGEYTSANGTRYSGEYKEGAMHGIGELTSSNGVRSVGMYEQNTKKGRGVVYLLDGTTVTGEWDGLKMIGDVTWRWPDGKRYIGEVNQKYQRHGLGTMIWPTGEKYIGEWRDGKADGWGIWLPKKDFPAGVEGIFRDDKIFERKALPKDFYQRTQGFFDSDL